MGHSCAGRVIWGRSACEATRSYSKGTQRLPVRDALQRYLPEPVEQGPRSVHPEWDAEELSAQHGGQGSTGAVPRLQVIYSDIW